MSVLQTCMTEYVKTFSFWHNFWTTKAFFASFIVTILFPVDRKTEVTEIHPVTTVGLITVKKKKTICNIFHSNKNHYPISEQYF